MLKMLKMRKMLRPMPKSRINEPSDVRLFHYISMCKQLCERQLLRHQSISDQTTLSENPDSSSQRYKALRRVGQRIR
jgi:hypothetical protein